MYRTEAFTFRLFVTYLFYDLTCSEITPSYGIKYDFRCFCIVC